MPSYDEELKYDIIWHDLAHPTLQRIKNQAELFALLFFEGFRNDLRAGQSLIYFGCKTAQAARHFLSKGLHVTLVDISSYSLGEEIRNLLPNRQIDFTQACVWSLPDSLKGAYWIYCCDVLEYIAEEYVNRALEQIAQRARFGGYFSIRLKEDPSSKHPLLTIKSKSWWEKHLSQYFTILAEDVVQSETYFNCRVKKGRIS